MRRILKIGMDVHTKNYTLCAVEPILGQEENILAQLQVAPSHTFVLDFIKKLKLQLGVSDKECDIVCGYEAGCIGYTLYHQLTKAGVKCIILAPTTMLTPQGQRIKTDKRDALLITSALREKNTAYPLLAIREAVANALIHQDFSISGAGPTVELFDSRIEIINPGTPLVDVQRIIDNPPKSRNEKLASLMRRFRMCEELGTGWDKIVSSFEAVQLPAPRIELYEENTKVTLYAHKPFSALSMEDKLLACYFHACVLYVRGEYMTNSSLRKRLGLQDTSSGTSSRIIREAVAKGLIKPFDPNTAPRYMKYMPAWG